MANPPDQDLLVSFDWTAFDSPSSALVDVIAEELTVDPMDLDPLYQRVDPDALNSLFEPRNGRRPLPGTSVEFTYADFRVRVNASGQGYVYPPAESPASVLNGPAD